MKRFLPLLIFLVFLSTWIYFEYIEPYTGSGSTEQSTETVETESTCGHAYLVYAAKEPTATEKGHTSYKICTLCYDKQGYSEVEYTYPCLDLLPSAYDRISIFNLSDKDKNEIIGMYLTVMSFGEKYTFQSDVSKSQIVQYFDILFYSMPETFMITRGFKYNTQNENTVSVLFNYAISKDKYTTMMSEIEGKIKTLLNAVKGKSDFDKVVYFNNYLIEHCTYTKEGENIGNIYGALTNGEILCDGFADITNFLCNAAGVKCQTVLGKINEGHAWNIVQLSGQYYYLDVTNNNNDNYNKPLYRYLGVSRSYIESIGFTIDKNYTDIVPEANSIYDIKNRYMPIIAADQNIDTAMKNVASYIVKNKPLHVYVHFESQSGFDAGKTYTNYLNNEIKKAYPNASIKNMSSADAKMLNLIITY